MMRKTLSFIITFIMVISSFSNIYIFADTPLEISITTAEQLENKSIYLSGKVTNPVENQEITIIAVKLQNGVYDENNSVYVDQQSSIINSDGTFSITFNPKVQLDLNSEYIIKVGGTSISNSADMKIKMLQNGDTEIYVGDANNDGSITVEDASLVLQYVLNPSSVEKKFLEDENFIKRMDVTGEKTITAKQASAILQRVLKGTAFEFPVEKGSENNPEHTTNKSEDTTELTTNKLEGTTEFTTDKSENTTQSGSLGDDETEETTDNVIIEGDILVDASLANSIPGENKYKTIREAIASIDVTPTKDSRVIIDIVPGLYREQLIIKKPYITLRKKPNTDGEVKNTWYYATGSMYDSIATSGDLKGFYDPSAIGDGEVGIPEHWGAALNIEKGADGIIVKDITFENSYNQYYTQEELNDGLTVNPDTNNSMFDRAGWIREQIAAGKPDEYINKWLQSRTNMNYKNVKSSPRERAAAIYCSADKFEAYNCKFISKQDTMGINSGREYYENCLLAGTVDYICGSATAVFNNCELKIDSGPDMHTDELSVDEKAVSDSGYITAPSTAVEAKGYLFYKCRITGNENSTPGTFGRPWGKQGGPEAIYYKTIIENDKSNQPLISAIGWSDMSGCKKDEARFYEYGSVDALGNPVDVSKRVRNSVAPFGTVINEWQILEFNPYNYTKGNDNWDPMNIAENYAQFDSIINDIKFNSNVTGDIKLPTPVNGYEYFWESNTDYAVVDNDKQSVSVIRPAYNSDPIEAILTVYIRKAGTEYGVKSNVKLSILPKDTPESTYTVNGKVSLGKATDKNVDVKVNFIQKGAVISSKVVTILEGTNEQSYTVEYLPEGTYDVEVAAVTTGYKVIEPTEGKAIISGDTGDTKELNIIVKELVDVIISTSDFSEDWSNPIATKSDSNCAANIVTGSSSLTANIGEGNKAIKFTKNENSTVKNDVGFYFDLAKIVKENGGTLENTDKLQFSMDLLLEKDKNADGDGNGYMASDYSYIDFTTKLNAANAANQGRYVRYGIYKSWNQLNFFTATNSRVNGDNTQFDKNSTMRNKWYHIVTDVDLKNQTITTSVYDKEKGTIINKEAFKIAVPNVDGINAEYPKELDNNNLYLAIYMDSKGNTSNRIEFYIDNLELKYQDFN